MNKKELIEVISRKYNDKDSVLVDAKRVQELFKEYSNKNEDIPVFQLDENDNLSEEDSEKAIKLSCFYAKFYGDENTHLFILESNNNDNDIYFINVSIFDDGIMVGYINVLNVYESEDNFYSDIFRYYIDDFIRDNATKLYRHELNDTNYSFSFISISRSPIDFTSLNTYAKIRDYLIRTKAFNFICNDNLSPMIFDLENNMFCSTYLDGNSEINVSIFDDWDLSVSTDTVTKL